MPLLGAYQLLPCLLGHQAGVPFTSFTGTASPGIKPASGGCRDGTAQPNTVQWAWQLGVMRLLGHKVPFVPQYMFFLKCGHNGYIDLWDNCGLQISHKKNWENFIVDNFCGYFGPWNYFSMSLRGKGWIAQQCKQQRLHEIMGQICLHSLPNGVLEPLFFVPQCYGAFFDGSFKGGQSIFTNSSLWAELV